MRNLWEWLASGLEVVGAVLALATLLVAVIFG